MIRYLEEHEKNNSEKLYREAFPEDPDAFVDYYYSYITKDNRILVMEQEGEICSMLHLNPYSLSVNGKKVDAFYYVAVATRSDCRHQGMMRGLLHRSLNDIHREGHPFTYLMPVNRAIYEPFDFRIIYRQRQMELPLNPEAANAEMAKRFDVYTFRDEWYVEKMLEEKRVCAGEPPFDIVPQIMARITGVEPMLSLLRSTKPLKIILHVRDEIIRENNGFFLWKISEETGSCEKYETPETMGQKGFSGGQAGAETDCRKISVSIAELTEFVFGRRKIRGLDGIKVLSKICINEAV